MQPFDGPNNGDSGIQIAYDTRRLHYIESVFKRATLKGGEFQGWVESHREPKPDGKSGETVPSYSLRHVTLCDAVAELGLERLDPGLERVNDRIEKMSDEERDALQHLWLTTDPREIALARCLAARAWPERQDEIFGWGRAGLSVDEYWGRLIPPVHMTYLIETADFGANETLRILYMLGETPEHLLEQAVLWRDPEYLGRAPNFPESAGETLRKAYTEFKYWMDDPFRPAEFGGKAQDIRSQKTPEDVAINPHEKMDPGRDMTYWSENHRILFAAAEYLAGQWWPDEMFVSMRDYRKEGPNGPLRTNDMTGRQHMAHAKKRVLRWLNERLRLGFSEWNAPGYYVEDLLPLLNLVDFAVDSEIRTRAAMVIDLLVLDLAIHSQTGAFAGAAGRAYFEHKNCIWEQSIRDAVEILFGQTGHFRDSSNAAIFLAVSPCYRPPDVLVAMARDGLPRFTTRTRASINFDESGEYGVGFATLDDMEFWWSRGAYATKQTILGSRAVAEQTGLIQTPPFDAILSKIKKIADIIDTAEDVEAGILGGIAGSFAGLAVAGPLGFVAGAAAGAYAASQAPNFTEVDAADKFSVLTEGSVLSRGNIYAHRSGGATLASVQNFRPGQLNFQGLPCVAALDNGAMVWTNYPSAGSKLQLSLAFGIIEINEDIFKDSHDGPNWWTGNVVQPRVVQQRGAAITAYKAKLLQEMLFGERTHAWFPKNQFDEIRGPLEARCNHDSARWFFGRAGDSYVGLFCALETTWTNNGPWKDKEIRVEGDTNVFITQIGCKDEFGSFDSFVTKVSMARVHVSGLHSGAQLECSYDVPFGDRLELHYEDGSRYGGDPFDDDHFPRHYSPYARIAWQQDRYVIHYAGQSLIHDVVQGQRTIGGKLEVLVHDTPLTFYAQNMALLPWPLYKGIDRDAALGQLITFLRHRQPDVVGLSEMWTEDDCQRITDELKDLYLYAIKGPHEDDLDLLVTGIEIMGGGLLLLSRHPIVAASSTIYRQCSGDDCAANKGVLHAQIQPRGHPCGVDLFLTHTQAAFPTVGGSTAGARAAVEAQIRHLAAFIRASRDPLCPAMLFGDFNVDEFARPDLYAYLTEMLGHPQDMLPETTQKGGSRPTGTSESDDHDFSPFHSSHPPRPKDDPARFGPTIERLDYLFSFPGLIYTQNRSQAQADFQVIIEQWTDGRDISDHYGILITINATTESILPVNPIGPLQVKLKRFHCLQTTSGPGDDEVRFILSVRSGRGGLFTQSTGEIADISAGDAHEFDLEPMRLQDPGDYLRLTIEGWEIDDLSADDELGRAHLEFEQSELAAILVEGNCLLAFPILRSSGGEYVVEVEITVSH
jgi:endonuclease/exonuclease/phosphatase family metal-dependent hydrolase